MAFLSLTIKANALCCNAIQKGWYLGERAIYKVFTCSTGQILTFLGGKCLWRPLRDPRSRLRTALSQQRAAVLKMPDCRINPCHLYADRDMAACDEVTFTNDP